MVILESTLFIFFYNIYGLVLKKNEQKENHLMVFFRFNLDLICSKRTS